jgi:two-component system chemotaxis sensor kinase CheA
MTESGYRVMEAADGAIAWNLLQRHTEEIKLIVTDIEMPNMNSFDLAKTIRGNPRYNKLPIIALTTLSDDDETDCGKAAGIDQYLIKLDTENLMKCVHDHLCRSA